MTILDKIRKARELVAAMDAAWAAPFTKSIDESEEQMAQYSRAYSKAIEAALALLRDSELLALGDEVGRLREHAQRGEALLAIEVQRAESAEAKFDSCYADLLATMEEKKTQSATIERLSRQLDEAEAKLAAAEGDARRWMKVKLHAYQGEGIWTARIVSKADSFTGAIDAAMKGER